MKRRVVNALCVLFFVTLLSGMCACSATEKKEFDNSKQEATNQETANIEKEAEASPEAEPVSGNVKKDIEEALGEWEIIASFYDGNTSLAEDDYYNGYLTIYEEDGYYKADWEFYNDGSSTEIYGRKIVTQQGALYGNCKNQSWYADFYDKKGEDYFNDFNLTLVDKDTLEVTAKYSYQYLDELGNSKNNESITLYTLMRRGEDHSQAIYNLRYPETITVSNVKELYNALGDNRRIILKEGTYNFSELSDSDKHNPNVNWRDDYNMYGDYEVRYINEEQAYMANAKNLIIEGEEGADVHICTNCEWVAPLAFRDSNHITLKNLRVGHNAQKGMCAGCVIYLEYTYDVAIENCRLYGCGTYGIWAVSAGTLNVTDCDIYECSYGLVDLESVYNANFENCIMRDSEDFIMFDMNWCGDIKFKDCTITGNASKYEEYPFIRAIDCYGDIAFENCTMENNSYTIFSEGDISIQ